jgi:hypothetical protein
MVISLGKINRDMVPSSYHLFSVNIQGYCLGWERTKTTKEFKLGQPIYGRDSNCVPAKCQLNCICQNAEIISKNG